MILEVVAMLSGLGAGLFLIMEDLHQRGELRTDIRFINWIVGEKK